MQMKRLPVAVLLAWLAAMPAVSLSPAAFAVHPLTILEDSLEMDAQQGRWPDEARGQMVLVGCGGCARDRFSIGEDAEFLLSGEPVPYRTLVSAIRSGRYQRVFVAVSRATGEITRVRVLP
jgi:hypothetical protein